MKTYTIAWLLLCELLGSSFAVAADRTTPIVFGSSASEKFKFDTNYSLPYKSSDTFLIDVALQRSLGTFRKTSVSQTDEFAPAITKRLNEYSEISKELQADLEKPLPEVVPPALKMVSLGTTASGGVQQPKTPWEYSKESIELKLAQIETDLKGSNRSTGLVGFFSLRAFLENNPRAAYLETARKKVDLLDQAYFANGVLKAHPLSDLSSVIDQSSKGKFMRNIINQCIVEPACNSIAMRVLVAHVDLFGTTSELPGIGRHLQQIRYSLDDFDQSLEIVSHFYAMEKLQACGQVDCHEAKAYYVKNLTGTYKIPEDTATICSDRLFKPKENQ
ncbi:MAG TPA: hypothetical protein VE954_27465 [Oligoflexus sp.]|uniref:hypothetical protein n=1 Tax=Oligoflexus sp. TaxID=1971216 RepID=UPI002D763302|nr:hypothetical protein [Oligoflexus sp.]HYX36864.1 hypothetical protein [Oligoflexus sp.]